MTDGLHSIIPTPVFDGRYIYGVCSYGQLRCLDASNGKRLWETLAATGKGRWWNAFLIPHEDKFSSITSRGSHHRSTQPEGYRGTQPSETCRADAEVMRRMTIWSHPAFAMKSVFARNDKEIVRVSLAADKAVPEPGGRSESSRNRKPCMTETLDIPADASQEIVVQADELTDLMVRMLRAKGMYEAEARIGAARLVEADLRGIHSHGSRSIWRYLDAIDEGGNRSEGAGVDGAGNASDGRTRWRQRSRPCRRDTRVWNWRSKRRGRSAPVPSPCDEGSITARFCLCTHGGRSRNDRILDDEHGACDRRRLRQSPPGHGQ